jgi:hypothetical protein
MTLERASGKTAPQQLSKGYRAGSFSEFLKALA